MSGTEPDVFAGEPYGLIVGALNHRGLHVFGQMFRCPAHDDHRPSLKVDRSTSRTGTPTVLLYCHAGCRTEDVLAALGLRMADLFVRSRTESNDSQDPLIREVNGIRAVARRLAQARPKLTDAQFEEFRLNLHWVASEATLDEWATLAVALEVEPRPEEMPEAPSRYLARSRRLRAAGFPVCPTCFGGLAGEKEETQERRCLKGSCQLEHAGWLRSMNT